jgi:serine phosphatase RsbU (regulator of sigma subunit)
VKRRRVYGPLVLTLAFLAILTALLVVGGLRVRSIVATAFHNANSIRMARIDVADVLREQLDEETGIRGYSAARQKILLQPYDDGAARMPGSLVQVSRVLYNLRIPEAIVALRDASAMNRRWLEQVAFPLLGHRPGPPALEVRGKQLVDRFRADMARIEKLLARREALADAQAQRGVVLIGIFAAAAVATVVAASVIFALQQFRLALRLEQERVAAEEERRRSAEIRSAYEVEKRIADTLQEGFTQSLLPRLPMVRFSATYLPATEEARIGGDWYDVHELGDDKVLIAIGDVAGHGISAAVAMNKTRHLVLSCALVDPNPGPMLQRVNFELLRSTSPMITALAGLVDARSCEFVYAAAGHPPPILLEPGRPARSLEVGSLPLGVMREAAYRTHRVQTVPGAMLVLYTDGAIEHSRDVVEGEAFLLSVVESAGRDLDGNPALEISKGIFSDRKIADDVAILTVRFGERAESKPTRVA